jgi:hypothetical protein
MAGGSHTVGPSGRGRRAPTKDRGSAGLVGPVPLRRRRVEHLHDRAWPDVHLSWVSSTGRERTLWCGIGRPQAWCWVPPGQPCQAPRKGEQRAFRCTENHDPTNRTCCACGRRVTLANWCGARPLKAHTQVSAMALPIWMRCWPTSGSSSVTSKTIPCHHNRATTVRRLGPFLNRSSKQRRRNTAHHMASSDDGLCVARIAAGSVCQACTHSHSRTGSSASHRDSATNTHSCAG